MKRLHIVPVLASGIIILLAAAALWAESRAVQDFRAWVESPEVQIEWTGGSEAGVTTFRLQRSFDGQRFSTIHTAAPTGDGSRYSFTDRDLFKGEPRSVEYRVEVGLIGNRTEWSEVEIVTLSFSNIRRTWGSIKAIFR
ncbi:MAG: hypothetical protein FJY67_06040 [Calditrichaeota bacterium]|nr:hypothetical protein [Calditrichota bacterium]